MECRIDQSLFDAVTWDKTGAEIEALSFKKIEEALDGVSKDCISWNILRRLIHTTADFSMKDLILLKGDPEKVLIDGLREGALIYSDSNMIKSGLSIDRIKRINSSYERDDIKCLISHPDVVRVALEKSQTRALTSVEIAGHELHGAIVLIGNAPLALAKIIENFVYKKITPRLIIGMPVGFVNVIESKELLRNTEIPHVLIKGRRGGSTLAVATFHALLERFFESAC